MSGSSRFPDLLGDLQGLVSGRGKVAVLTDSHARTAARMAHVTNKPESPDALLRTLLAYSGDSFEDRLRDELAKETFIGGKRVVKQELPRLPKWAQDSVHVVKVNLHGAKPPVWRRLEIPSFTPLDLVHEVLQIAFG
jgi:hypothetical protein